MRYKKIDTQLFVDNRKKLTKALKPQSLALFNSNDLMPTNADGHLPFRQNNDLFYLSGVDQENSILVICPDFPDKKYREVLFLQETNEQIATWEGHKLTKEEARELSGVQTIVWTSEFGRLFHHMMTMGGVENVYLNTNEHYRSEIKVETRDARFIEWCKKNYPLHEYQRVAPLMAQLRSVKSNEEIDLMQQACNITESAFRRVLKFVKPGVKEYEIEAEYSHEFLRNGSRGFAYTPIIASGANSCVLHYIENDKVCKDGDILLLDVGAEYANYNADLTRSIPLNGRYSKRQREVYDAVLRVMRAANKMLRPGVVYFDYHKEIQKLIESELIGLRLISKTDVKNQPKEKPAFQKYFMHGTSHMLGLDVHDVGNMHAKVREGQVWTIEPGIYIKEEGLGIRIENNVVIGTKRNTDLMRNVPIEADEIETLMNQKK
ncbi:MAG: aminopeptidase P N-terminal domain-containing protein [Cyclobacteriaceae bacterium]|jgi:Xaa-Pro aminopeptidase|nr:aminopeptidase P family protein [Flammeovirgaceae bacterium]